MFDVLFDLYIVVCYFWLSLISHVIVGKSSSLQEEDFEQFKHQGK
jgi:hypothetical protein